MRNLASANMMLRSYARRPQLTAAVGGLAGSQKEPLMRFFASQARKDEERHRPGGEYGQGYKRPPYPDYPTSSTTQSSTSDVESMFSPRRTTGFDYRPFSEPVQQFDLEDYL